MSKGIDASVVKNAAEEAAKQLGLPLQEGNEEAAKEETVAAEEEKDASAEEAQEEEVEGEESEQEEEEEEEEEIDPQFQGSSRGTVPKKRFNKVYGRMKQLERAVQYLSGQQSVTQQQPVTPQQTQEKVELPDFEVMTNKELALWLVDTLGKKVDTVVQRSIEPVILTSKQEKAIRDVENCAKKYSDYVDYRDQMIDISNRYPALDAEAVYAMAKGMSLGEGGKVVRNVARKAKAKIELKRKAVTEKRSSPSDRTAEVTQYKNVRDAGLAIAKKLGL